jgi:hypothetical protein
MGLQQFASVAVVVTAFASDGGALMASQRDSIDPQALYESRAGSIEVFDHGLRIWHVEGQVHIERLGDSDGASFYVMQEMDGSGSVRFAGFAHPGEGSMVDELFGTLQILPDGSLHIEYDAIGMAIEPVALAVTKFAAPGATVLVRSSCECSDPGISGCATNQCNDEKPCDQDPQQPSSNKCRWRVAELIVQPVPTP